MADVEAVAGQFSSSVESAVDTVRLSSAEGSLAASAHFNSIIDKVKSASEDVYTGASASVTMPSVDMSQFASYTEKASQLSADVMSKSSKLADQVSGVVSEQMESMPEYQAQLAAQFSTLRGVAEDALADATDASESVSRQFMTEILPRISSELQSFTQLAADGHYADAATSPAGIAAAGASVLLIGGIAASSSSSSASAPPSPPKSSTPAPSPADNQASAEAWIAQWRTKDTPAAPPGSPQSSSSEEGSSSSEEAVDPAAAGASSNGAFSTNGAVPAAEATSRSMEMTIAEYVSGDATSDDSAAGGWYVTSDSEAEDSPYSEIYAQPHGGGGGGGSATETAAAPAEAPAAATSSFSSDSESSDVGAYEAEAEGAGVATGVATAAVDEGVVEIRYFSGWQAPTIHACAAGGEWGEYAMERDAETGVLSWRGAVNANAVPFDSGAIAEFVITDGAGDWDKSPEGENYRVYECGTYDLRDGQLWRVKVE